MLSRRCFTDGTKAETLKKKTRKKVGSDFRVVPCSSPAPHRDAQAKHETYSGLLRSTRHDSMTCLPLPAHQCITAAHGMIDGDRRRRSGGGGAPCRRRGKNPRRRRALRMATATIRIGAAGATESRESCTQPDVGQGVSRANERAGTADRGQVRTPPPRRAGRETRARFIRAYHTTFAHAPRRPSTLSDAPRWLHPQRRWRHRAARAAASCTSTASA
jgi:hypothetical protein